MRWLGSRENTYFAPGSPWKKCGKEKKARQGGTIQNSKVLEKRLRRWEEIRRKKLLEKKVMHGRPSYPTKKRREEGPSTTTRGARRPAKEWRGKS